MDEAAQKAVQRELAGRDGSFAISDAQKERILSSFRLKLTLTVFLSVVILLMSGMMVVIISRIFASWTPSIEADLQWKTQRGAIELAQSAQLEIVLRDHEMLAQAFGDYVNDRDVLAIVVTDARGVFVDAIGTPPEPASQLVSGWHDEIRVMRDYFVSWSESIIDGAPVGRVALVVSKARLRAGVDLRNNILRLAGAGCLLALVLSLFFVNFYLGPLIRLTENAFARLQKTTAMAL
jgi:hypothetical protein